MPYSDYKKKYQREATEEQLKNLMNARQRRRIEIDIYYIDLLRYNKHILLDEIVRGQNY